MKRLVIYILITCVFLALAFHLQIRLRTESQVFPVIFPDQPVREVTSTVRPCVSVGFPHMKGWYLDSGRTEVSFKGDQGAVFKFVQEEELQLVGLHSEEGRFCLIFIADYEPARGFLVFMSVGDGFVKLPLTALTADIAFANVGVRGMTSKEFFSVRPLPSLPSADFYETSTAWLWSQVVEGQSVLSQGLNREGVDECWKQWAPTIAGKTGAK